MRPYYSVCFCVVVVIVIIVVIVVVVSVEKLIQARDRPTIA